MRIAIAGATGLVGRELGSLARKAGHEVVELSRATGVDLVDGADRQIDAVLTGVDAVVDVTNSPTVEQDTATAFFSAVGQRLGAAASRTGVRRTVLLSIIGVDRTPEDGYFVAKLAHERATERHAPGVVVQSLGWTRHGDVAAIPDMPVQPVALAEVARMLLDLATEPVGASRVELAGPRPERLVDMVTRLVAARGEQVRIEPAPVSAAMRAGALLPGPDAVLAGPDFADWLAARTA